MTQKPLLSSCRHGHPLTDENTYRHKNGSKACKTCRREATYRSRAGSYGATGKGQGWHNAAKTHCPRGHEYTEENTYEWRGRRSCRACYSARVRSRVLKQYGLTVETFDSLLDRQDGVCAICQREFARTPHVDHDHKTGEVRGLLCYSCNSAVGYLQDDVVVVRRALEYLIRAQT